MSRYTLVADRNDVLGGFRLRKHSRESAQAFRDAFDIAELRRQYLAQADDAVWSSGLPPEVAAAIAAFRDPPEPKHRASFMDRFVKAEQVIDKQVIAWFSAKSVDSRHAAAFLAAVLAAGDDGVVRRHYFGTPLPCDNETVGLMAASGAYSCLAIEAVPRLVGWRVGEYDGLEYIDIE